MAGCEVSGFKKSSPMKRSKQEALQITKNHYNNETDIVITNIIKQIGNKKDDLKKECIYPSLNKSVVII